MARESADRSPRILSLEWGRMEVEGLPVGKDFMLYPGGGREWDWRTSGTRHRPGIVVADVQALLDRGATALVLSRGMDLELQVAPETVEFLQRAAVPVRVEQTEAAVRVYNELAEHTPVGGLFHSTC